MGSRGRLRRASWYVVRAIMRMGRGSSVWVKVSVACVRRRLDVSVSVS